MKNEQLVSILNDLGLSEKEARVYFAALSLGPSTILTLSHAAELKRTTIYALVDSLKKKGLIAIHINRHSKPCMPTSINPKFC